MCVRARLKALSTNKGKIIWDLELVTFSLIWNAYRCCTGAGMSPALKKEEDPPGELESPIWKVIIRKWADGSQSEGQYCL